MPLSKTFLRFQNLVLSLWGARAFLLRVLLALSIGVGFLLNDFQTNYDLRFKFRGTIHSSDEILLVLISDSEWRTFKKNPIESFQVMKGITEADTLTDFYYWDEDVWARLISTLLEYNPKRIGVTFFFGKNLGKISVKSENQKLFENNKIAWAALTDSEGRPQMPLFSNNPGIINLPPDYDGTVRRFSSPFFSIPHLGLKISNEKDAVLHVADPKNVLINYQGLPQSFKTVQLKDILNNRINPKMVEGKIVIIGSKDSPNHMLPTPLGFMSKAEIVANIVDNANHHRWPIKLPLQAYILFFIFLIAVTVTIVNYYPQSLALAITTAFTGLIVSISTWIFDHFNVWIPIVSTIVQVLAVYTIFIGYKLTKNERKSWRLEQEKKYLFELEQLKNNFISLISHDLKTPIAKIQGIVERLMKTTQNETLAYDLNTLKSSSQDLQKYIQSILQVSRIESSDFKVKKEARDINQIIEDVLSQLNPLALEKSIAIDKKLEPLFSVEIDGTLIQEVIVNMIENAIKYTSKNGRIVVVSEEVEDGIVVRVTDTGDGIPIDESEHIWEKFYRGKKHNLVTKGTGLGLYLVKYFIELHGGSVFMNSKEGVGTTIGFKIPFVDAQVSSLVAGTGMERSQ